jgi:purine-binding chemotaxis protein CheW
MTQDTTKSMTPVTTKSMSAHVRSGVERRTENRGGPEGVDRRAMGDRRAENNVMHVQFRIGDEIFLVEILQVQEVLQAMAMTPVPRAPALIVGLLNLRGDIVPVIDLRPLLELPPPTAGQEDAMLVVIRSDLGAFSLLVDDIYDVQEVSPTVWAPVPANLPERMRLLLSGVYRMPDALRMALDLGGLARLVAASYVTP